MKIVLLFLTLCCSGLAQEPSPSPARAVSVIEFKPNQTEQKSLFADVCKLAGVPDGITPSQVSYIKFEFLKGGEINIVVKYDTRHASK